MNRQEAEELKLQADEILFAGRVEDSFRRQGWTVYRQARSDRHPDRVRVSDPSFAAILGNRVALVFVRARAPRASRTPDVEAFPAGVEVYVVKPGDLGALPGRILAGLDDRERAG